MGQWLALMTKNYTVIKLSKDYALGIKIPTSIEHVWLMQRVRQLVLNHASGVQLIPRIADLEHKQYFV